MIWTRDYREQIQQVARTVLEHRDRRIASPTRWPLDHAASCIWWWWWRWWWRWWRWWEWWRMKTTNSIEPCLRHWLTLIMNHTDSLEVWASLHKNAGNHLHSQEDPLSKKEKMHYLNLSFPCLNELDIWNLKSNYVRFQYHQLNYFHPIFKPAYEFIYLFILIHLF